MDISKQIVKIEKTNLAYSVVDRDSAGAAERQSAYSWQPSCEGAELFGGLEREWIGILVQASSPSD